MSVELEDGTVLTRCDNCRQAHSERTPPTDPPCSECRVDLLEENEETARIFNLVRNQVITAGPDNMPIDLNYGTVLDIMDLYGVTDKRYVLESVRSTFYHTRKKKEEQQNAGG